ncbi:sensor histidine kinase [Azoarcus sp. KH32C]|uniref:sensor histidine kinase n=1 Tax=Azoarcus sp. KH32C TaxID=748247 RepID=UPI000238656A|nr:ATP-binding protein [Azoarcus sp. KH32C]BAL26335.1 putative histidine kinase [Azoarcus sp. KH32C]
MPALPTRATAAMVDRPIPDDPEGLRSEVVRLKKIVRALMGRAERDMNARHTDFGWFQDTIRLEDQVRARTRELEEAQLHIERINRDLQSAKDRLEREVDERRRANAALEQAMEQLVQTEKLAALGSLVAGVAHELNTPLGNSLTVASALSQLVQGFNEQLEAGTLRKQTLVDFVAQCRDAASLLEKNCRRAAELIGNFKQVAVDQTSMRRRRFDLRQSIEEVLSTLHPKLKHTAYGLELAVPAGIELDSFPGPIEQIVANLVNNSLQHGFEGRSEGHIHIAAEVVSGGQILLHYSDDGAGIPDAIAKRVFDPFFTTRLGRGGSGLGLYIVYNLATAALGGTIELTSGAGRGARFDLRFPRVAPSTALRGEEHDGPG